MNEDNKLEVLMKSNTLVKARYNLTLMECRVFMYILYSLQKSKDGKMYCYVTNNDFARLSDNRNLGFIKGIKSVLDSILDKHIYFEEYTETGEVGDWGKYNLINGYMYLKDSQKFKIEVSEKVFDLLISYLDTGYTPVNLNVWLNLKSISAQRLYELLRLWSGSKKSIEYTVEDIKNYMMLEEKYKEYSNFKRRIITPGIKELNETGLFNIDFKETKVGRKVNSIIFDVDDMDARKYFDKEVKELVPKVINDISNSSSSNEINQKQREVQFYVPDESVFTKGTLRSFKMDFKEVDFKNRYMDKAFNDAIMITLDRDDVEQIKATSYRFFKGTLDNKIIEYKTEEKADKTHEEEMGKYW
ncbi:MAG: replication initiation protein [Peptostreptococcaceae bacterium]